MRLPTVIIIFFMIFAAAVYAQTKDVMTAPVGEPSASSIGDKSLELKQITISDCEEAGFWETAMWQDQGFITLRVLPGNPKEKEMKDAQRIKDERTIRKDDKWLGENVLAAKVNFYRRGNNEFSIMSVKPIPIAGTAKIISVWVVGRNYNHELRVIISDFFGNRGELSLGKLNFSGWKKLSVAVPPTIPQSDFHLSTREGIKFLGLKVICDLEEAYGTYYIYFDDISAETDLFSFDNRDIDDMDDGW